MKNDPKITKLARELGLDARGNAFEKLQNYAIEKAISLLDGFPCENLDYIRKVLSQRLEVHVEVIERDSDISVIAEEFNAYHPNMNVLLDHEFIQGDTEGLLFRNEGHQPGDLKYIAIVDARGEKSARAYFSIWHELSHLLVASPQLEFDFRRTPTRNEIKKDPVESLVDSIAGSLAFYEPIFGPILREAVNKEGEFNFRAIETARLKAAPTASFLATILAAIRLSEVPVAFISADWRYKISEKQRMLSKQLLLIVEDPADVPVPKLRVEMIVNAHEPNHPNLGIHKNMRIPEDSIIYRVATEHLEELSNTAQENLSWWETSSDGQLPSKSIRVISTQCGSHTYALIFPLH